MLITNRRLQLLKTHLKTAFVVVLVCSTSLAFGEVPPDMQGKLWGELQAICKQPLKDRQGKGNIIEDIELTKKMDGVSIKAAALASVVNYYNKYNKFANGDGAVAVALRQLAAKKKLTNNEMEKLQQTYQEHNNKLRKEYEDADKEVTTTQGISISKSLDNYLKKNGNDIRSALSKFAANRGYSTNVFSSTNYNYQELIGKIDNKIPLLFNPAGEDNYFVIVGYLNTAQREYLLIADPRATKFKEVSHASFVVGKGKLANDLRKKTKKFDKQFGMAKLDCKLSISDELPDGISFVDFKQKGAIYIVNDFGVSETAVDKLFFKSTFEKLFRR